MNAGRLAFELVGNARRIRPESLADFCAKGSAKARVAREEWRTVSELLSAASVGRAVMYRYIANGALETRSFGGVQHIRTEDFIKLIRDRCRR